MQTYKRICRRWTESENKFLKDHYARMAVSALAKQLKRSEKATRSRLERLGYRLSALPRNQAKPKPKRRKYHGWHYDSYGRKQISVKGRGSVAEHRYMVEQRIGRRLKRSEHVHHINCDKKDNRIENLHLFKNVSSHSKCRFTLEKLARELMERNIVKFDTNKGEYKICANQQ